VAFQCLGNSVSGFLIVQPDDKYKPAHTSRFRQDAWTGHTGYTNQVLVIPCGYLLAIGQQLFEPAHLDSTQGCIEFIQPVVVP